ncbi:cellulose biosynthesis protein BcsC [Sphingomonas sp. IC081]|uniref:cellulose biosynthesis protein BcsC n=1 Tax=Sphingomonas sp. IC081 TaxID=304378 RepID=UPI0011598643|nr:cellulose biosynthesis protein BcsC [Sphingomonas sp. IC081]QDK35132.1 cellulose synthase [Sphingomonas sp. IC081]
MTVARKPLRLACLALLLASTGAEVVSVGVASAQDSGVAALLQQARYWRSKGREDLAQQALRRARALDPNNPAVAQAMNGGGKAAPTPAAPAAAKPAATASAKPAQPRQTGNAASASRPGPTPAKPVQTKPAQAKPAPSSASNRAGQARVAGFAAIEKGDLDGAASQFQRALAVNPRDADALGGLGIVRLRQSRFAESADLLGQASRLGRAEQWSSGLAAARFFAGLGEARDALARGDLTAAQTTAEALVHSGYPQSGPAVELLANIYEQQGRHADAAELYRQAGQTGNASSADDRRLQVSAARSRALAAAAAGDDLGATREFQNGLVADPEDPWIRYEFAEFNIKRGRVPEAEALLRSLVSKGKPDALYAAALLNADLDRPAEASRLIDMIPETQRTAQMRSFAVGVKTDEAIARAKAMGASGQSAQALASLRQLGSMSGIPVGKQAAIANALYDLGDTAGAAAVAENATHGNATGIEDYEGLIGTLARVGRDDLARDMLQRAGSLAGGSADSQRAYARMNGALMVSQADRARLEGRFAESFDILQSAWSAAPDNMDVLAGLARLYQSGRMPARAAQAWQLVLARKPGDRDALLGLADTAQAAGDDDLSRKAQNDVLRAFPQDYEVRMTIARIEQSRGNNRAAARYLKEARALYTARQGGTSIDGLAGGNPFAAMSPAGGANPFRNQAVAAPQAVNPFALGSGTRLPSAAAPAYAPAQAYAAAPYQAPLASGAGASPAGGAIAYSSPYMSEPVPADAASAYPADPVMAQIQSQLANLTQETGPRVDVDTGYRQRSGEKGLSRLDEIKGSVRFSTDVPTGRVYAKAEATVLDAGSPSKSGQARFGQNATIEADNIVAQTEAQFDGPGSVNASGVAFSAGYESDFAQAEAGTTPIGMGKTKVTFRGAVTPEVSPGFRVSAVAERKPVTDSVLSYAGVVDPVSKERWGQVMRTGFGGGLSYDRDGSGVYGEGRYYRFNGTRVVRNDGFEANVGGYLRAYASPHSALTVGLNVNYQDYDKSQNYFTWGNGGYFSPQSFISVGFPVNYTLNNDRFDMRASFTPGFQSYSQDASPLYPTDADLQGHLDDAKADDNDVRSFYDESSKTGFALSALLSLYYKISPTTRIGGETSYNTFGTYNEFRSLFSVRQNFGNTGR